MPIFERKENIGFRSHINTKKWGTMPNPFHRRITDNTEAGSMFNDTDLQTSYVKVETVLNLFDAPPQRVLKLNLDDFLKGSIGIFGVTGSGKTITIASILEEFCMNKVPFTVFDLEGGYASLNSLNKICDRKDINVEIHDVSDENKYPNERIIELAKNSFLGGKQVVIQMLDVDSTERQLSIIFLYILTIWEITKNMKNKRIHFFVIDEAHNFLPESSFNAGKSVSKESAQMFKMLEMVANKISTMGRKRGLFMIVASQRVAQVKKSILTQLKTFILHKLSNFQADSNAYEQFLGTTGWMKRSELITKIRMFRSGRAIFLSDTKGLYFVKVRNRLTEHTGETPDLDSTLKVVGKYNKIGHEIGSDIESRVLAQANLSFDMTKKSVKMPKKFEVAQAEQGEYQKDILREEQEKIDKVSEQDEAIKKDKEKARKKKEKARKRSRYELD